MLALTALTEEEVDAEVPCEGVGDGPSDGPCALAIGLKNVNM